ncbi:hypothetical protein LINPERPRIM_LOCUS32854 [Linum perenne]
MSEVMRRIIPSIFLQRCLWIAMCLSPLPNRDVDLVQMMTLVHNSNPK